MVRKDFHHPFQPYDIQQQFMESLYDCIENGQVGIFESPTGTGKSLSLICGALTWLREHKRRTFDEAIAAVQIEDEEPEWMLEHAKDTRRREMQQARAELEARLQAVREKERRIRGKCATKGEPAYKRQKRSVEETDSTRNEEVDFVLDEYESDDERQKTGKNEYSVETAKLMEQLGMMQSSKRDEGFNDDSNELKIFVCSRTHSQLSQFVGELQRVKLPPGMPMTDPTTGKEKDSEELKQLSLGSRKNLCINPEVSKLEIQTAINERCVELQQSKTTSTQKCRFLPKKDNDDILLDFRDHALAKIRDIEDLAKLGAKLEVCPYYASRPAIGPAEIVTLPYPLLLQKAARHALGISVKGHVVIVDEAHNILQAIEGIHSSQISETQLKRARESLMIYLQKFRNRLKGSNRIYVTQVVRVIDSILLSVSVIAADAGKGGTISSAQLLSGNGVDQINLTKLVRYIGESKLARKVEGYISYISQSPPEQQKAALRAPAQAPATPTLTRVQNFLMTLMNPSAEGQFFWFREVNGCVLRYMLLDPSEHFRDLVEDARAVILVGGTMSPMHDYQQQLFPYLPSLHTFSCGHLIPQSSLLVRSIESDSRGGLDFSFKSRNQAATMAQVGKALLDVAPYVRGGLVVFFPSYSFLEQVTAAWRSDSTFAQLQRIKPVFSDSRSGSAEDTFKLYGQTIQADSLLGAILLSVIGGKLSEGINFSDDLARCVVVVGLPFPNLDTPEWIAKMKYIDDKDVAASATKTIQARLESSEGRKGKASMEHATNLCMRSVNQAIGRVIRHKEDWACVLLMDGRYTERRIRDKLPEWIRRSLPDTHEGSSVMAHVANDVKRFFEGRK